MAFYVSLRVSTSADGKQYDVVCRHDGNPLERLIDVAAPTSAALVRVSLEDKGPLHFRQVIGPEPLPREDLLRV